MSWWKTLQITIDASFCVKPNLLGDKTNENFHSVCILGQEQSLVVVWQEICLVKWYENSVSSLVQGITQLEFRTILQEILCIILLCKA